MTAVARWKDLVSDSTEPAAAARFWAGLLGRTAVQRDDGGVRLDGPTEGHRIWVDPVPERRTAKDRVHLDVIGDVAALRRTVERLGGKPAQAKARYEFPVDRLKALTRRVTSKVERVIAGRP